MLGRIEHRIQRENTNYRPATEAGLKLCITLRYLASGDSYHSLMYLFRVPHNSISLIVKEVCEAIIAEYQDEVIKFPQNQEEWKEVAKGFSDRWNFHHCCGALDGKHLAIQAPPDSGSIYYNYKGFYSIILMALVDSDYKFIWVNIGTNGSAGDANILNHSELKAGIEDGTIELPAPDPLPHDDRNVAYFFVGDDAFALKHWMMKPHSKRQMSKAERIFNYRLSRARRIVENAFGILAHRFRCILKKMNQTSETVTTITLACVCLHNLLRMRYPRNNADLDQEDDNHNIINGAWRNDEELANIARNAPGNRASKAAKIQRAYLTQYYSSPVGAVPWQDDMI